jgi:hypothetical protein
VAVQDGRNSRERFETTPLTMGSGRERSRPEILHLEITIRQKLLIGPVLGLLEDASRLFLGTCRDEELDGADRVRASAALTSNIDRDALGFESAFGDLRLDP